MVDNVSKAARSAIMRRIKGRNTGLEWSVRTALHRRGMRYRISSELYGKPDIVFPGARMAVFIDSCFWHGCTAHCRKPATNKSYWDAKIRKNAARDKLVTKVLRQQGWRVIRIWEHSITNGLTAAIGRI